MFITAVYFLSRSGPLYATTDVSVIISTEMPQHGRKTAICKFFFPETPFIYTISKNEELITFYIFIVKETIKIGGMNTRTDNIPSVSTHVTLFLISGYWQTSAILADIPLWMRRFPMAIVLSRYFIMFWYLSRLWLIIMLEEEGRWQQLMGHRPWRANHPPAWCTLSWPESCVLEFLSPSWCCCCYYVAIPPGRRLTP